MSNSLPIDDSKISDRSSPVALGADILRSGSVNFDAIGGNPSDQYYGDVESIVLSSDPTLAGTAALATNPSQIGSGSNFPGNGLDVININPDLINGTGVGRGYSDRQAAAVLLH